MLWELMEMVVTHLLAVVHTSYKLCALRYESHLYKKKQVVARLKEETDVLTRRNTVVEAELLRLKEDNRALVVANEAMAERNAANEESLAHLNEVNVALTQRLTVAEARVAEAEREIRYIYSVATPPR